MITPRSEDQPPYDVEFETLLHRLEEQLKDFKHSAKDVDKQVTFCRMLRETVLFFKTRILPIFGRRYRGGTGGKILLGIASEALSILGTFSEADATVKASIVAYVNDLENIQASLDDRSVEKKFVTN